jgi:type II secretory pathway pseudopilin PulG
MIMRTHFRHSFRRRLERGSMLIELMIALVVLAVGLGGIMVLLVASIYTNANARNDTASTMVAEHVMEQITAQPANGTTVLTFTDCSGATWNIDTVGAAKGAGNSNNNGGDGANLTSLGTVDWTQDYTAIPAGYKMQYTGCGAGGRQTVYDVRWNIITMFPPTVYSRMVMISARPVGSATVGGLRFIVPVNLRTIGGM